MFRGIKYLSKEEQEIMIDKEKNPEKNYIFQLEGFVSTSKDKGVAVGFAD